MFRVLGIYSFEIGTNWRGISSTGASEWDCPNLVPNSNWDYFNDAGWVTANSGDILVQCSMKIEESESKIINDNSKIVIIVSIFFNRYSFIKHYCMIKLEC